jgi:O-antigen ligase
MNVVAAKSSFRDWPIETWVAYFLAASLFAIPVSSTAKSILTVIALGLIAFSPSYRLDMIKTLSKPWCQATLALFFVAIAACLWSPASFNEESMVLSKYSKLLYLPILVVGFRDERARRLSLYAFLSAMLLTCLLSILKDWGLLDFHGIDPGEVFRNHIMTSYMMAFAAYLACFLFFKQQGVMRVVFALMALLFSYQVLFINTGRTGYVIYLLLMVLLILQSFSWRQALLALVLGASFFATTFYFSPVMQEGVHHAITDLKNYEHNKDKDTNVGFRLQFHDYAHTLFQRHPWFGNGTASFMHLYHEENPIPARGRTLIEPHSQYWLVAVEFGLLGCFALAAFFGQLWLASWRLKRLRPIALGVLIPFFIGNLSDSLLFYSGTGYFFLFLMAICLAEEKK